LSSPTSPRARTSGQRGFAISRHRLFGWSATLAMAGAFVGTLAVAI
jgi:hypothetical protein